MTGGFRCLQPWLEARAAQRLAMHGQRQRQPLGTDQDMLAAAATGQWVNFSSNDYLGLANHGALAEALAEGARRHGVGSGASALVSGYHPAHQALEDELADFLGYEAALLCSSGYLANLAVAASLAGRGDRIVQDRLCHASLIDAARLSGARLARYPHGDLEALERQLSGDTRGRRLVVTDGVFSMDGDIAPLPGVALAADRFGATLVVDDAHGIGVRGPGGRGSVAAAGLDSSRVPVLVGTLGKAFGCSGAFVAGSRSLVEHLVNEARTYIYTTAMPPALAEAGRTALRLVASESWRRERLGENIDRLRAGAADRGIPLLESATAIQPLVVGDAERALALSRDLRAAGFLVVAIRPPTVPAGSARLRITLSAAHQASQVDGLLDALDRCLHSR